MEAIADKTPGRLWFQAFVLQNQLFFWKLIERVHVPDDEALVITGDFPIGGRRERDLRNDFSIPFRLGMRNTLDIS